jgi:hypothetical protein
VEIDDLTLEAGHLLNIFPPCALTMDSGEVETETVGSTLVFRAFPERVEETRDKCGIDGVAAVVNATLATPSPRGHDRVPTPAPPASAAASPCLERSVDCYAATMTWKLKKTDS